MSLIEEIKKPEGIEAVTYGRNNNALHDEIAMQMAEFEVFNKVTVIPAGVSSEFTPITHSEHLKKDQEARDRWNRLQSARKMHERGELDCGFDNSVKRNRNKARSGYQNLRANKDGTYMVMVGSTLLGSHPLEIALQKRDAYRAAIGLKPAENYSC